MFMPMGELLVDQKNRQFKINKGSGKAHQGHSALGKLTTISTFGMNKLASKAISTTVNICKTYSFDDLVGYELLEDNSSVTKGGAGKAIAAGVAGSLIYNPLVGAVSSVAGGITSKRKSKRVVESMYIRVSVRDSSRPCVMIPLITKPTKIKSSAYKSAFNKANTTLSALNIIANS